MADNSDACPADNPNDIDGDGICNSADPDQDGDGCVNGLDPAPTVAATAYNYETHVEPLMSGAPYFCTDCHTGAATWNGNFDLTVGSSYASLVDGTDGVASACVGTSYTERVSPGNPSDSFFYIKMAGTQDCGDQMPQFCSDDGCVSSSDLAMIYMWICQGAPEN